MLSDTTEWVNVSYRSVITWFENFHDICARYLHNHHELIGGVGVKVEVDESVISKQKFHRCRVVRERWIVGGICPETRKSFIELVQNRRAPTLNAVLEHNIAPGSIVCTDMWRGYNQVTAIPVDPPYEHHTVNYSQNFVDPVTGTNTNHVERMEQSLSA